MKNALKILSKNLGVLIVRNKKNYRCNNGWRFKRAIEKNNEIKNIRLKIMSKNPISINQNELAVEALSLMTSKRRLLAFACIKIKIKTRQLG